MICICPHCKKENKIAGRTVGEAPHYKPILSTCGFCGKQYSPIEAEASASAQVPAAAPPKMDDHERWRRFKRMAMKMASMIAWPDEETFIRASGDVVCEQCGLPFFNHPEKGGLWLNCAGQLLKL